MASNFNFKLDVELPAAAEKALVEASEKAFKQTAAELNARFTDAISSNYWAWDNRYGGQSKRGLSGSTVKERARSWKNSNFNTGPQRSIVDSGELKQSGSFVVSSLKAKWSWTAPHAAAVHEGARIKPWGDPTNATVTMPARPWTTAVIFGNTPGYSGPTFDFSEELKKRIQKLLN